MPDSFRDLQSFYKSSISQSIGASDTTIPVNVAPTITAGYFILEPNTANEELILLTGVAGLNLTVVRGLAVSGSSESAGTGLPHSSGVSIINGDSHLYIKRLQISKAFEYRGNYAGTTAINAITNAALGDLAIDNTTGIEYWYNGASWIPALGANTPADATTIVKGITKMSVAPASAASPISVGDNDPRVPTASQALGLPGNNGTPGSANKFVTQSGFQNGSENAAIDTGALNALVITLSPVPAAYVDGERIYVVPANTNTLGATINKNGLGAKTINKPSPSGLVALSGGELVLGVPAELQYNVSAGVYVLIGGLPTNDLIAQNTTIKTVANDNTLQTFATYSIPGGTLGTNRGIKGKIFLSDLHNAGTAGTFTLSIIYGATTIFTITFTFDTFNVQSGIGIDFIILANAATNAQTGYFTVTGASIIEFKTTPAITANGWLGTGGGTAAEDSTVAKNLVIKGQWGTANSNLSVTYTLSEIEKLF